MHKSHNSSELARQVSERLHLNQEDGLRLYEELSQIPNGYVKDALDLLSAGYRVTDDDEKHALESVKHAISVLEKGSDPQKYAALRGLHSILEAKLNPRKYVACIKGTCVRDAKYSVHDDADPLDDGAWRDVHEVPLFIGIIEAETPVRAKQIVAAQEGVDTGVIELKEI